MKKILAMSFVSCMISSVLVANVCAESFNDTNSHWAESSITRWSDLGIIMGYEGNFRPNDSITRGEVAVILDRIMGYEVLGANVFSDLDQNFYTDSLLKANSAEIILGSNGEIRPKDSITRQEMAVMICRAMHFDTTGYSTTNFADDSSISSWAREAVAYLTEQNVLQGTPENNFAPLNNMTRAEVSTILDRVISELLNKSSTYTMDVSGNVVLNSAGATLENMYVSGDLIIAQGVCDGDVYLNNVIIDGNITIKGGGENSIYLNNTTVGGKISVSKANSAVRVVTQGATEISTISVSNDVYIKSEGNSKINAIYVEDTATINGVLYNTGTVLTEIPSSENNQTPETTPEEQTENEYTISKNSIIEGGNLVVSHLTSTSGDEITIEISVESGFELESLVVLDENNNEISVSNNKFTMPESNVNISAVFAKKEYTISVVSNQNGLITVPEKTANVGDEITVYAIGNDGYELEAIYVNGTIISNNKFTMPAGDVIISASFAKISEENYQITVGNISNGSVSVSQSTAKEGDVITVTASPASGYELLHIYVDGSALVGDKFTMPDNDVVITAIFTSSFESYIDGVLQYTNEYRQSKGLSDLILSEELSLVAQAHAEDMFANSYFSHTSLDGTTASQRVSNAGIKWSGVAENIAKGQTSSQQVVTSWINSAGHEANMTGNYQYIGIGYCGNCWVQVFIR